uniref:Uncharacterized protein n=1 Tax=Lutzomyia longipalpis TaxID=7200 RepID=A0A1B0CEI9_LUTLO
MAQSEGNTRNVVKQVAVLPRKSSSVTSRAPSPALLSAYKELLGVVFKIPNESVKARVLAATLAALNGESPDSSSKSLCHCSVERIDRSTQTTLDEEVPRVATDSAQKPPILSVGGVVKGGRKRKVLTPTASTGKDLGVRLTERQKLLRQQIKERPAVRSSERLPSETDLTETIVEGFESLPDEEIAAMLRDLEASAHPDVNKVVKNWMLKDWIECTEYNDDGYLPIHTAALESNETLLKRQCLTLNFRKLGVDLETLQGHSALQIALISQSDSRIISLLLEKGADATKVDQNGNNCALLAAKHAQSVEIFTTILRKTSLTELQRENFSTHGIFRIVVDSGKLSFLHELLRYVDECLGLQSSTPELKDEKNFITACKDKIAKFSEEDPVKMARSVKINDLKARMINQRDRMAGKTPLFCAVEKQKESLMLALLVNYADPRVKTFIGVDAYTVASEVLMQKKISVPLSTMMNIIENINLCERQEEDLAKRRKHSLDGKEKKESCTLSVRKARKRPIHTAALESNETLLKRQCLTLNFRKLGVDLETLQGHSALQIALISQSDSRIISLLIEKGADATKVDRNGNNCAHLAAKYAQNIEIFTIILRKTTLTELQRENFSTHGIFRIVVDSGKLSFLHELLRYVDECLGLQSSTPELKDEKNFITACEDKIAKFSEEDPVKMARSVKINDLKARMINQRDRMAGKTPLFCAVEKQKESLMLALLVNYADPRVKTFIGVDAYTVASEVLMQKKISVPLSTMMNIIENINLCERQEEDLAKRGKSIRKNSSESEEIPLTGKKRRKVAR